MRIFIVLLLFAACGDDKKPGDKPATTTSRDALIAKWKKGGLAPSALTPATVAFGKDCHGGTVGAIEVLVCNYPAEAEAKAAADAAYGWVGEATGAVKVNGSMLIAAVDRRKSDPSGRTINQLVNLSTK
ncbi:MAG TPA: hypothetical protein VIU61_15145 [Kofleriaceae bacterium]